MDEVSKKKYKAFISYRHKRLDMFVAKKLQRTIERYVIPADLREQGQKRLGRVFRDQSELTLSSDLAQVIQDALDNSEYLIVVCTPDAAQSKWVNEEISYFLSKNDRNHVLAVLASGEPSEAFPKTLTEEVLPDGTVRTFEPLAANIAGNGFLGMTRAFPTEILRILSALIGCTYDTLYRRDQRYRVRQMMITSSAVVLLAVLEIGLLINRNLRIRTNYNQSLKNQSIYYAAESRRLLNSGDRFSAVKLAMEALPSAAMDRPVVSQAVLALSDAENIYTVPSDDKATGATGVLSHNADITDFILNSDGMLLCSMTHENTISLWNTSSMKQLWKKQIESSPSSQPLRILDSGNVCIMSGNHLMCLNRSNGEPIWDTDMDDLIQGHENPFLDTIVLVDGSDEVLIACSSDCYLVSLTDGSLIRQFSLPSLPISDAETYTYIDDAVISSDGKYLIGCMGYYDDSYHSAIAVIDTVTGGLVSMFNELPDRITNVSIYHPAEENAYYISYEDADDRLSIEHTDATIMSYKSLSVCSVELMSGKELWKYDTHYVNSTYKVRFIPVLGDENVPLIACTYSNRIDLLDPVSGEKIAGFESESPIINARSESHEIIAIDRGGERLTINTSTSSHWFSSRIYVNDLVSAEISSSRVWALQEDSSAIICYGKLKTDPLWAEYKTLVLSDPDKYLYRTASYINDDIVAILYEGNSRFSILLGDGSRSSPMREIILPEKLFGEPVNLCYIEDCYNGKLLLTWYSSDKWGFMDIDISTLKVNFTYPEHYRDSVFCTYAGRGNYCVVYSEDITSSEEQKYYMCLMDSTAQIRYSTLIGKFTGAYEDITCVIDPEGMIYAVVPETAQVKKIDTVIGTRLDVPNGIKDLLLELSSDFNSGIRNKLPMIWSRNMSFAAARISDSAIKVTDNDGNELFTVAEDILRIKDFSFTPDSNYLITVGSDNRLRRYDIRTGDILDNMALYSPLYENISLESSIEFPSNRDFFIVSIDDTLNLISTSDWGITAYLHNCVGYQNSNDLFLCTSTSENAISLGSFPRYTVKMLVERARELLNGWDLTNDQRTAYGLSADD